MLSSAHATFDIMINKMIACIHKVFEQPSCFIFCSHGSSGDALFALTWTCIVFKEVWTANFKSDKNDLKNLVCKSLLINITSWKK